MTGLIIVNTKNRNRTCLCDTSSKDILVLFNFKKIIMFFLMLLLFFNWQGSGLLNMRLYVRVVLIFCTFDFHLLNLL